MSLAAAFVMIAQSAAPAIADAPRGRRTAGPIYVTASARVIRPVEVRLRMTRDGAKVESNSDIPVQRRRDKAGTVWIEFN
ncbi:hypothetical protein [uncultured Erythrobacter sp.]|uniref:hypothetical protein n=1 Tax=uncultured Erythrobacter sp. TaxID=263913 RepID=UPI00261F7669|nr:hypothetical protein [uncultured Erythrobacter sp.]